MNESPTKRIESLGLKLPPAPKPQSYDMVTFCKTYGGVKHCERVTRDEARALTWREYERMLNRMGRF